MSSPKKISHVSREREKTSDDMCESRRGRRGRRREKYVQTHASLLLPPPPPSLVRPKNTHDGETGVAAHSGIKMFARELEFFIYIIICRPVVYPRRGD